MPNHKYHDKFKELVDMAWRLRSMLGIQKIQKKRVNDILEKICADPKNIKPSEKNKARKRAKEQYIALMFLMHSNKQQYGDLINDIENEYTCGSENFPQTLRTAFEILISYKSNKRPQFDNDSADMFYNDRDVNGSGSKKETGRGRGRGGCGRGGHGGRGGRSGRGRDNPSGRGSDDKDSKGAPEAKDSHLMVNDDLESVSDYLLSSRVLHF